jgi:phage shock protein A
METGSSGMPYFSRLTDIVTCNLTKLLEESDDPQAALQEIVHEMELGLAGARRSATTAQANEERLREEVDENSRLIYQWSGKAREALGRSEEDQARLALVRKREAEALVDGLKEELTSASETRSHLLRTMRALEARLSDAKRKLQAMTDGTVVEEENRPDTSSVEDVTLDADIEDELAALKRELGRSQG